MSKALPYDSRVDTNNHINRVRLGLLDVRVNLHERGLRHDRSKLEEPEKSAFDVATPKLKGLEYGSAEYRASLREIKPAIEHHYEHNDHHPEHYEDGILGMSLLALVEMLADWKAAGERHDPPTPMMVSLEINAKRFGIPRELVRILGNTIVELGWDRGEKQETK